MTIREMEEKTGVKKANIRYYEEQGLLKPLRNKGNNYREYTLEDVETLNRIKFLRMLGSSVQDIHRVQQGEISLPALMEQRERELAEERTRLEEIRWLCERVRKEECELDTLEPERLQQEIGETERRRLEKCLQREDRSPHMSLEEYDRRLTLFLQILGWTFCCTALLFRLWIGQRIPPWTAFVGVGLAGVILVEKRRIRKKMEKGFRL